MPEQDQRNGHADVRTLRRFRPSRPARRHAFRQRPPHAPAGRRHRPTRRVAGSASVKGILLIPRGLVASSVIFGHSTSPTQKPLALVSARVLVTGLLLRIRSIRVVIVRGSACRLRTTSRCPRSSRSLARPARYVSTFGLQRRGQPPPSTLSHDLSQTPSTSQRAPSAHYPQHRRHLAHRRANAGARSSAQRGRYGAPSTSWPIHRFRS